MEFNFDDNRKNAIPIDQIQKRSLLPNIILDSPIDKEEWWYAGISRWGTLPCKLNRS
jgi:hypothetical protein